MKQMLRIITIFITTLLILNCSTKFSKVPDEKFVGVWEIKGRKMFEGIQIKIEKENDILIGRIYKLNDNKFVKMFCDSNAVWISELRRASDFEFILTENKIASDLFSVYGLSTSQEFKIQFIDNNTIGLGTEKSDPLISKKIYKRIN